MSALALLLSILLWIVLAALGLALLVLAFPLDLRLRAAVQDGEPSGSARARWAFGLVTVVAALSGLRVRVAGVPVWRAAWRELRGGEGAKDQKEPRRRAAKEPRAKKAGGRGRAFLDHRRTLLRMLARFARALHLRLRLRGTVGLGDPIHTARLAGALELLGQVPGVELEVEVDWLDENLEGQAAGSVRVWVPELLAVAAALLFERANRVALRALAR
jgi:hypothetical protein